MVRKYKSARIVTETDAEVFSAAFIVMKPDGTPKMIVDYRGVNKATIIITGKFERVIFGLANAPKYFAKLMDRVLGIARRKKIAFNFFDDVCIFVKRCGRISWISYRKQTNLTR